MQYAARCRTARCPYIEAMVTIDPPPFSAMWRAASCAPKKRPSTFTSITFRHASRVCSRTPKPAPIPALPTHPCSPPSSLTAKLTSLAWSLSVVTSTGQVTARRPAFVTMAAVSLRPLVSMSPRATSAPSTAAATAQAWPIPDAAPVIPTTRFLRCIDELQTSTHVQVVQSRP